MSSVHDAATVGPSVRRTSSGHGPAANGGGDVARRAPATTREGGAASQSVGRVKRLLRSPGAMRRGMNVWPPLLFAGIRIEHIDPGFRRVRVRLARTPLTTNYFGTQFGGSLFAMTGPFWVIMLARNLGPDHVVARVRRQVYLRRKVGPRTGPPIGRR